jgi:hypothetical protein
MPNGNLCETDNKLFLKFILYVELIRACDTKLCSEETIVVSEAVSGVKRRPVLNNVYG